MEMFGRLSSAEVLATQVSAHIQRVRQIDAQLQAARALVVIENNYGGQLLIGSFVRALEADREIQGTFEWLDVNQALDDYRHGGGGGGGGRSHSGALAPRGLSVQDGVVFTRGNRTGANNKPMYFGALQAMIRDQRLRLHARLVATSGRRPEEEEDEHLHQLQQHASDRDVLRLLGLDTPAARMDPGLVAAVTSDPFGTSAALRENMVTARRQAHMRQLHVQFRGIMLIYKERLNPRTGEKHVSRSITGKESAGPHDKKDDLIVAMGQLIFSLAAVVRLPQFAELRRLLALPEVTPVATSLTHGQSAY